MLLILDQNSFSSVFYHSGGCQGGKLLPGFEFEHIKVTIVNQGNEISSNPLIDTFLLPQQLGAKASGTGAASNTTHTK
jgi:hypothetical protein